MKILTLFVRYGTDQYADSLNELLKINQRIFSSSWFNRIIVIDNKLCTDEFNSSNCEIWAGDNSLREFSGWDAALQRLGDEILEYDLVQFVTSAFRELYTGYLEHFSPALLESALRKSVLLGHIDSYPDEVGIAGYRLNSWIRSCFYFVKSSELRRFGRMTFPLEDGEIFSSDLKVGEVFPTNIISDNYKQYILSWLTGDGYDGTVWHSVFRLSDETFENFKIKTKCIMNEHLLSSRFASQGILLCDVGWLKRNLDIEIVPDVKRQLAERGY